MIAYKTKNKELIESILNIPELYNLTNGQGVNEPATISPGFEYLIVEEEEKILGMFSIKKQTEMVMEGHIRILPEYWKTVVPTLALNAAMHYIKMNTNCLKVMTTVPGNCFHVLKFMKENRFRMCGCINEGIVYNNELVSLLFFEKGLA